MRCSLLQRGVDPNRVAADGMTFSKMLIEHREHFAASRGAPAELAPLWEQAQTHGILRQPKLRREASSGHTLRESRKVTNS